MRIKTFQIWLHTNCIAQIWAGQLKIILKSLDLKHKATRHLQQILSTSIDSLTFTWETQRNCSKLSSNVSLARRYYPVQWQYISGSINTLRVKDIFCFSEITQCSLNDTAFISGGWPGVVDKVCSRTVIIFLSTPVPPPLVW